MNERIFTIAPPRVAVDPSQARTDRQVVLSRGDQPTLVAGRRAWIDYRELGVTAATAGTMRAQVIQAAAGETKPSGWHFHRCDMQFLYVLSGAIRIAFNPDDVYRLVAGDSIMIPGGTMHIEMGEPDGVNVLEVTLPAEIGTEDCVPPWAHVEIDMTMDRDRDMNRDKARDRERDGIRHIQRASEKAVA